MKIAIRRLPKEYWIINRDNYGWWIAQSKLCVKLWNLKKEFGFCRTAEEAIKLAWEMNKATNVRP